VDVYFGPKSPAGKESNWVPASPGGQFEVLFRLYGPEKPLFDKTSTLRDVEPMEVIRQRSLSNVIGRSEVIVGEGRAIERWEITPAVRPRGAMAR
jgi:Protein of unknown function (DUF1214)